MKRILPLVAVVAAFFIGAIAWMSTDRSFAEEGFDDFSVENTGKSGLSIASAFLARTGHRVAQLDVALRPNAIPSDAVVIRAGRLGMPRYVDEEVPERSKEKQKPARSKAKKSKPKSRRPGAIVDTRKRVSPLLDPAEDEWVRGGGRLVLASTSDFGPLKFRGTKRGSATKVFPIWPQLATIAAPSPRVIAASTMPPQMHALFTLNGEPAIVREIIGRGEVIVVAIPEILQNESLRRPGALLFLESLAPRNRPIYFDETVHGFESSDGAIAMMKEWALGPFLLLLALAALLYFWRHASRIGPAEDDHRETRSDAVDLVRSLGTLYSRSMTDDDALSMYRDALVRSVAAQTGLRGDPLHARVAALVAGQRPAPGARRPGKSATASPARRRTRGAERSFQRDLERLNEAFRKLEHGRTMRAAGELHANHR